MGLQKELKKLLLVYAPVFVELERQILDQNKRVAVLAKEHPALNTFKITSNSEYISQDL